MTVDGGSKRRVGRIVRSVTHMKPPSTSAASKQATDQDQRRPATLLEGSIRLQPRAGGAGRRASRFVGARPDRPASPRDTVGNPPTVSVCSAIDHRIVPVDRRAGRSCRWRGLPDSARRRVAIRANATRSSDRSRTDPSDGAPAGGGSVRRDRYGNVGRRRARSVGSRLSRANAVSVSVSPRNGTRPARHSYSTRPSE